jgi:hypothetical protein
MACRSLASLGCIGHESGHLTRFVFGCSVSVCLLACDAQERPVL